jgi:hypothetical protein
MEMQKVKGNDLSLSAQDSDSCILSPIPHKNSDYGIKAGDFQSHYQ